MNAGKRDESGQEAASAAQVKAERKPRRRRWPWIILGVIALLAILVALLPTLLSLGPARRYLVSLISERLNGQLEIKSWSLGWFSGFRFSGIKVTDAEARPVIEVASVNVPATIPSLLGSTKRLGETEVQGLKANVAFYSDGTVNLEGGSLTASSVVRETPCPSWRNPGPDRRFLLAWTSSASLSCGTERSG